MGFLSGLSSAFGVAGALLGSNGTAEQNKRNQAFAYQQWLNNYNAQKEFAQNGLRWKVEDAKAAGLHPLFAVGASGASYSPVNAQSYYENEKAGLANSLSNMGQSIGRAVSAKETRQERIQKQLQEDQLFDLDVRQKEADIALTNARISALAAERQQQVPPMANTSKSDIPDIGTWVRLPNNNFVYLPSNDYMDYFSEKTWADLGLQHTAMTAFEDGSLKPPYPAPSGKKWRASGSGLKLVDISDNSGLKQTMLHKPNGDYKSRPWWNRDIIDHINYFRDVLK